jgi:RNA polymerase sigma-70 factor (sigma-E family)
VEERKGIALGPELEREYIEYVRARLTRLHRLAYLLCGDGSRADDIVQSAMTTLYVHWGDIRVANNLDAYVRTMVVRSFLSEKRRPWSRVSLMHHPPDRADPGAESDSATLDRLLVRAALRKVPPRQQAVLVLRFVLDLSVADVAGLLGCTEGTVKSQTAKGLGALRKALDREDPIRVRQRSEH